MSQAPRAWLLFVLVPVSDFMSVSALEVEMGVDPVCPGARRLQAGFPGAEPVPPPACHRAAPGAPDNPLTPRDDPLNAVPDAAGLTTLCGSVASASRRNIARLQGVSRTG